MARRNNDILADDEEEQVITLAPVSQMEENPMDPQSEFDNSPEGKTAINCGLVLLEKLKNVCNDIKQIKVISEEDWNRIEYLEELQKRGITVKSVTRLADDDKRIISEFNENINTFAEPGRAFEKFQKKAGSLVLEQVKETMDSYLKTVERRIDIQNERLDKREARLDRLEEDKLKNSVLVPQLTFWIAILLISVLVVFVFTNVFEKLELYIGRVWTAISEIGLVVLLIAGIVYTYCKKYKSGKKQTFE